MAWFGVTHPRANVLWIAVHFAQSLPPSPSDQVIYSLADDGTPFAVLNQQPGSGDSALRNTRSAGADTRTDPQTDGT